MSEYADFSNSELVDGIDDIPRVRELVRRLEQAEAALAERDGKVAELQEGIRRAMNEIGVPGDGYPANIANAYSILHGDCARAEEGSEE